MVKTHIVKPDYSSISDFISDPSFHNFVLNTNATDQVFWETWIKNHPDKKFEVQQAIDFIRSKYVENIEPDPDEFSAELQRFKKYLNEHGATNIKYSKKQRAVLALHSSGWLRIAATVTILLVSSVFVYQYMTQATSEEITAKQHQPTFIEKVNPKGQKSVFMLPDGSLVKLNADSKLIFPETFQKNIREVTLEGEAFFEVKEDLSRPFIVKTSHLHAKVLGTSFNIRAYEDENTYEVALLTGRVQVHNKADSSAKMILLPNELAIYNNTDKNISKTKFDPAIKLAWRDNTIYFENSDFSVIIKTLERWYGVNFVLPQGLEIRDKFTGIYKDKTLHQVLEGISFSLDFQFKIDNKIVFIKK